MPRAPRLSSYATLCNASSNIKLVGCEGSGIVTYVSSICPCSAAALPPATPSCVRRHSDRHPCRGKAQGNSGAPASLALAFIRRGVGRLRAGSKSENERSGASSGAMSSLEIVASLWPVRHLVDDNLPVTLYLVAPSHDVDSHRDPDAPHLIREIAAHRKWIRIDAGGNDGFLARYISVDPGLAKQLAKDAAGERRARIRGPLRWGMVAKWISRKWHKYRTERCDLQEKIDTWV